MGFADTWSEADPEGGSGDDPPREGIHDVALIDARAFESKNGAEVVVLEFQTVDKQHQWSSLHGFKTSQAAGFTKGACQKVGVDVASVGSLEELDAALKTFVGGFYEVEVKKNGDFINTYVNDGVGPPKADVPADTEGLQPVPDDGEPAPWEKF